MASGLVVRAGQGLGGLPVSPRPIPARTLIPRREVPPRLPEPTIIGEGVAMGVNVDLRMRDSVSNAKRVALPQRSRSSRWDRLTGSLSLRTRVVRLEAVLILLLVALWLASTLVHYERHLSEVRSHIATVAAAYTSALTQSVHERVAVLEGLRALAVSYREDESLADKFRIYEDEVLRHSHGITAMAIVSAGQPPRSAFRPGYSGPNAPLWLSEESEQANRVLERAARQGKPMLLQSEALPFRFEDMIVLASTRDQQDRSDLVAVVQFTLDSLLEEADAAATLDGLSLTISDDTGHIIYGAPSATGADPVVNSVALPFGTWEVATAPQGGWTAVVQREVFEYGATTALVAALVLGLAHLILRQQVKLEVEADQREQARSEVREGQRALSTLMSNLPGMAYRCRFDDRRTFEFASEGSFGVTSFTPAALVGGQGIGFNEMIDDRDLSTVRQEIGLEVVQGRAYNLIYRLNTAVGVEKWVLDQGQAVVDGSGAVIALEGFVLDVTDRRLAYHNLESRVAHRTRYLSALYDVTAVASGSLDLREVLERSLERILAVTVSLWGAVYLDSQGEGDLTIAAARGGSSEDDVHSEAEEETNFLVEWVYSSELPRALPEDDSASGSEPTPSNPCCALAGVPVRAKGSLVGVLLIRRELDHPFNGEEMDLLSAIGDQMGTAVANARLHAAAQGKAALEERQRLARELHDSVTQLLYSLTLMAEASKRLVQGGQPDRARNALERLGSTSQQALREMRLLVYELRPMELSAGGIVEALRHRLDAVEKRAGMRAELHADVRPIGSPSLETEVFRIAQEALNNTLKHSSATEVWIELIDVPDAIELTVADNGRGFDLASAVDCGGMGLANMRERAERLGGTFMIDSQAGRGTTIRVRVPCAQDGSESTESVEVSHQ